MARNGPSRSAKRKGSGRRPTNGRRERANANAVVARRAIAALRLEEIKHVHLPAASGELGAVVAAAAEATHSIMDATETIESVALGIHGHDRDMIVGAVTQIYEACGFQDITGQRVTKVVKSLREIEATIDGLLKVVGGRWRGPAEPTKKKTGPLTDADLLAGPQRAGEAKSQEEIDRLFTELG